MFGLAFKLQHGAKQRRKQYFVEYRTVFKIMWRSMVKLERTQMTILYGACSLRSG